MQLADYLPILILLGLATAFAVGSIAVATLVGPRRPSPAKSAPYESGLIPERAPRERFPIKFYVIAMLFIIFDIEVVFFYPFAVLARELGLFGLIEMGIFVALLLVAYVYVLRARGLEWEEERPRLVASREILDRLPVEQPAERRAGV